jgi:hypothetical protein
MKKLSLSISDSSIAKLIVAAYDCTPISGLTHDFYRYPARFSPNFARAAIEAFTKTGDVVYDPFMGGGTTLVEASVLGRKSVGTDINKLAVFIAKVKTTLLTEKQLRVAIEWLNGIGNILNLHNPPLRAMEWIDLGYQKNISGKTTWPIRKLIEFILAEAQEITDSRVHDFVRCALLRTGQWALDCRESIPRAEGFKQQFSCTLLRMVQSAREYRKAFKNAVMFNKGLAREKVPKCLNCSAIDLGSGSIFEGLKQPRLILTSPPYPGVHALYHRWQVNGRRETPAPFWIANCLDGNGASFYTLGDRKQQNLVSYFQQMRLVFNTLARISNSQTILVQLVAFSSPEWQLQEYLSAIKDAGFVEIFIRGYENSVDGRIWRTVPNRKFYADYKGLIAASKEVLLLHRLE